jgi:23S rRNA pseudouridine1911/1915/1917 synthase
MNTTYQNTLTFKISYKYSGYRIDRYLGSRFNFRSRNWWKQQICKGAISLHEENNQGKYQKKEGRLRAATHVLEGNICEINEIIFSLFRLNYESSALEIIYSDDSIIVINKPAGLIVHPINTMTKGALTCLLEERLKDKVFLCHRLDRLTSGVMVIARTAKAASEISRQFRENEVKKEYEALVENSPLWNEMRFNLPIGPDENSPIRLKMTTFTKKQISEMDENLYKDSCTNFKLVKSFDDFSLIKAKPETGRTHQIRVHLSALNLPVVRDKLYGSACDLDYFETGIANLTPYYPDWHGLHAKSICFSHPESKKEVSFSAKTGKEMNEFIASCSKTIKED